MEDGARRVARALVDAELGDPEAWHDLDDAALLRLRSDVEWLLTVVPWAVLCLLWQLVGHPRAGVRIDVVRMAKIAYALFPDAAQLMVAQLARDPARGVSRAAEQALAQIGWPSPEAEAALAEAAAQAAPELELEPDPDPEPAEPGFDYSVPTSA